MIRFTVITSIVPDRLTKRYDLAPDGTLRKTPGGQVAVGHARHAVASDLRDLIGQVDALAPNQAITCGLSSLPDARVVAKPKDGEALPPRTIARARDYFAFPDGPGVFMLDHDPLDDAPALTAQEFHNALVQAVPALADAPMVIRPSASSGVRRSVDGVVLKGLHGWRAYVAVAGCAAVPAAGERLVKLLQAAGHALVKIDKSGRALDRTLVDASVWQPERLDFCVRAELGPGLQRVDHPPLFFNEAALLFDLSRITVTNAQERAARDAVGRAQAAAAPAATARRQAYALERGRRVAERTGRPAEVEAARIAEHLEGASLPADYLLCTEAGQEITVDQMLADPDRFNADHGERLRDPIDPDRDDGDHRIACLVWRHGAPFIHSHAHGGMFWRLHRDPVRVFAGAPVSAPLPEPAAPSPTAAPPAKPSRHDVLEGFQRWAVTTEKVKDMEDTRLIWRDALAGSHLTVWAAPANAGKTSVALLAAAELAEAGHDVFFFQEDAASGDLPRLHEHAQEHGYTLLNSTLGGTSTDEQVAHLRSLAGAGADLQGIVMIFDTLKKYLDLMQKAGARDFFKLLRSLTQRGATVLLLGHTNKHVGADGKRVFEGVGDVRNDVDELAYLESTEKNPLGVVTITLSHDKTRSRVVDLSFELDTTTRAVKVLPAKVDVHGVIAAAKQSAKDQPVIDEIVRILKNGPMLWTALRTAASDAANVGEKAAGKVIDRYDGKIWRSERHRHRDNARQITLITPGGAPCRG